MNAVKENSIVDEILEGLRLRVKEQKKNNKSFALRLPFVVPNSHKDFARTQKNLIGSKNKVVVVKNIANMGKAHFKNALLYILKNANNFALDSEMPANLVNNPYLVEKYVLTQWGADINSSKPNAKVALHLVFSLDEINSDENREVLLKSVKESLEISLNGEYEFVLAVHSHQNKPHCHVLINKTNKFNNKKLHFKTRDDCKEFYFNLKEQFKNALCANSKGRLRYENSYQCDYFDKKIKELEQASVSKDNFYFEKYMDLMLESLYIQQNTLKKQNISLSQSLDELNPSDGECLEQLKAINSSANLYVKNTNKITEIKDSIDNLREWNRIVNKNLSSYSKLKQKEMIVKTLKQPSLNKNLPKHLINKLRVLEKTMLNAKAHNDSTLPSLVNDINVANKKANAWILKSMLNNLDKFRNVVAESSINARDELLNKLNQNKNKIQALLYARIDYCFQALEDSLDKHFLKKAHYLLKELESCNLDYNAKTKLNVLDLRYKNDCILDSNKLSGDIIKLWNEYLSNRNEKLYARLESSLQYAKWLNSVTNKIQVSDLMTSLKKVKAAQNARSLQKSKLLVNSRLQFE